MNAYIWAAGFVVLMGLVWGVLRYEFEMPRLVSIGFGGAIMTIGGFAALLGHLAGLGLLGSFSGVTVGVLASLLFLLTIVN